MPIALTLISSAAVNEANPLLTTLAAGVVSGLVATAIIFLLRSWWVRIIFPWYENALYQGPVIEGPWTTEIHFADGTANTHRIELKRTGYRVLGKAFCTEGQLEGQTYELSGSFNNLLLTAEYRATNTRRMERGAFTLMLVKDGSCFQGHLTYSDDRTNSVLSVPCIWEPVRD